MMWLVLQALVVVYLLVSAGIALATIDQPRRAFDLPLSLALAATRVLLALVVLADIVTASPNF